MKLFLQIMVILASLILISCNETSQETHRVITCTTIDDCSDGQDCIDGFCKKPGEVNTEECISDGDCPNGYTCNDNSECVAKICESKADCDHGKICVNTRCVNGCESNSDCENNETCNTQTKQCEKGEDCRIEDNCGQGFECDQLSGRCVAKLSCSTQADCAEGYKCEGSQCIAKIRCYANEECSNGEVCRVDGYCDIDTGCDSDQYCLNKNPGKPACNTSSGMCYECVTNEHCSNLEKPICNTMTHTCGTEEGPSGECQADSDCGMNKRCNTNVSPHECIDMMTSCHSDNDCQSGMHCNTSNGRCVMCLNDSQCTAPKKCNTNTYICEEEGSGGGGGDNNGLCADLAGALTCVLMGGSCEADGNCNVSSDPCDGVSCPANSTCNNGSCECNTGYHDNGSTCVENETCSGVSCPVNSHCELNNYEAGCYCDSGYTATDTDNDGKKDTCVADNPCSGVTCSGHGSCVNNNGSASCNCDAGYHANGLYCIQDAQTCDLDQFSNPLNNSSSTAKTIDFGTYNNLTLSNSNCTYVEDWYKIQLYPNTEFKFTLTYTDTNSNITVKLYKQPDTTTAVAGNTSPSANTREIAYTVTEENTYFIRVYIYYQSEQRAIPYSMTVSSRAVQSGNPAVACSSDNQCYGESAICAENYTSSGYCTAHCTTVGATCMDTGVCDGDNCFKRCTAGNDTSCGRSDLVCKDYNDGAGPVCVAKCYSNSDCSSNYCTANGHCELHYMNCNQNDPLDDGCAYGEFCTTNDNRELCFPHGNGIIGSTCQWTGDCVEGTQCIGSADSDTGTCTEVCKSDSDCSGDDQCYQLSFTTVYGYCD